MVAITDVPPDQIPEGLLNLARGHHSSIEHIHVLISADSDDDDAKNNETKQDDSDAKNDA
jgi:BRCA1-associated protein